MPRKRIKRVRFADEQYDDEVEEYTPQIFNSSSSGHRAAECWCATCKPSYVRRPQRSIRVLVNIRYRGTRNYRVRLPEEIVVDILPEASIRDLWNMTRSMNSRLHGLRICRKAVCTDSYMSRFHRIPWNAEVGEVYDLRYRHWIFVVEKPSRSRRRRKYKRKKSRSRKSASCL